MDEFIELVGMQGHGERMVEDQDRLVLHLGMSLAWAPRPY